MKRAATEAVLDDAESRGLIVRLLRISGEVLRCGSE
jgi:hypothetical protein